MRAMTYFLWKKFAWKVVFSNECAKLFNSWSILNLTIFMDSFHLPSSRVIVESMITFGGKPTEGCFALHVICFFPWDPHKDIKFFTIVYKILLLDKHND